MKLNRPNKLPLPAVDLIAPRVNGLSLVISVITTLIAEGGWYPVPNLKKLAQNYFGIQKWNPFNQFKFLTNNLGLVRSNIYEIDRCSMSTKSGLTHIDDDGKAKMVDVSDKSNSWRMATATGTIYVGPMISSLIKENSLKKGDVFSVAQLAGVIGAKKTSELIPLCHNISLNLVEVKLSLNEEHSVKITCKVKCHGKTGVEMEALTGVSVAALTVYDMCKAVTHDMVIGEIKLVQKSGGKQDYDL